jgi:nucleoid-associated protein YgaU
MLLVVALLLAVAGGVTWDRVYRLEARASAEAVPADRLLVLVEGGGAAPREQPPVPRPPVRPRAVPKRAPADGGSPAASAQGGAWRVARGDSLYTIASRALGNSTRWREIAELNGIAPPYRLDVGQELRLP